MYLGFGAHQGRSRLFTRDIGRIMLLRGGGLCLGKGSIRGSSGATLLLDALARKGNVLGLTVNLGFGDPSPPTDKEQ